MVDRKEDDAESEHFDHRRHKLSLGEASEPGVALVSGRGPGMSRTGRPVWRSDTSPSRRVAGAFPDDPTELARYQLRVATTSR